ncbi:hypothetical protein [Streptomyces sp. NBC_00334]|uniref:hypothetical protein n=1 Tax=Streptomyces sp. NBC_00334 TaxID=2975713 RepID=UPI002E2BE211|nr:hypothetical protein [Streptomyces sp. NBC_00334]
MASIVPRPRKSGETAFQVKWRQDASWQTENFGGDEGETQTAQLRALIEAHGNRWPHGWVKGRGFVEPDTHPDDVDLVAWAHRYADGPTGIEERTRADYKRDIDRHFTGVAYRQEGGSEVRLGGLVHTPAGAAPAVPATVCNVTADDIRAWVSAQGRPPPATAGGGRSSCPDGGQHLGQV